MTDLATSAGPDAAAPGAPVSLPDELARLARVLHALKSSSTAGGSPEARERAAHVLLFPIVRTGPLRQGALAELVHSDPSTVSRHVTLLVDRGLVRRVADDQDGRVTRLVATPAGEAVVGQMRTERNAFIARCTRGWAPAELDQFTRQLHRFVDDLADALPVMGTATGGAPDTAEKDR
ncbi:MarR family transcriptional regulator [Modestobacter sp. NPDC049651]|uniref:MarR family winged helix-turn-helix transcriptional regulator n=1 Tax=unclassified Modestobacter TaxID=2643866 RepID=UPI0033F0DA02